MSTRTEDVDWHEAELDVEGDGTQPHQKRRESTSLATGEKTDHREDNWYAKSKPTPEQKRFYNEKFYGKSENIGDTHPRMYRASVVAIGVAIVAMCATMFVTMIAQGGWFVDLPLGLVGVAVGVGYGVLNVASYIFLTAGNKGFTRWATWIGAALCAALLGIAAWLIAVVIFQLSGSVSVHG